MGNALLGAYNFHAKGAVTLGNFSSNLSRNFIASLRHKLPESLPSVTCVEMNMSRNVFVVVTVARSRTDFYFSQRLRQQKNCKTCSFQSMLHLATIRATCVATKLKDKLQEKFNCAWCISALSHGYSIFTDWSIFRWVLQYNKVFSACKSLNYSSPHVNYAKLVIGW